MTNQMITKTELIKKNSCPYRNPYQGPDPRVLFVCSAGLLRSPTAAELAIKQGFNARSCGADLQVALIPLSENLIIWSDKIVVLGLDNLLRCRFYTDSCENLSFEFNRKVVSWEVFDIYDRNQKELVEILQPLILDLKERITMENQEV